eukprot:CAMPEP_0196995878 /NCGR_PEP_ID=MMETSP1380-20130617/1893_1 /TAXON_ID=5936 /ORGANISM="Euplotes crassus, Strain CT5" /LENGTH=180 /DNA_ID=CAMNT_0042411679 /DNA_START=805 /DNA_END=1347 /DNA_ORIENTATION=+
MRDKDSEQFFMKLKNTFLQKIINNENNNSSKASISNFAKTARPVKENLYTRIKDNQGSVRNMKLTKGRRPAFKIHPKQSPNLSQKQLTTVKLIGQNNQREIRTIPKAKVKTLLNSEPKKPIQNDMDFSNQSDLHNLETSPRFGLYKGSEKYLFDLFKKYSDFKDQPANIELKNDSTPKAW